MPFTINGSTTCYLLPADERPARKRFLELVSAPGETWIIAYSFTVPDAADALIAAHKRGVPLHLYLDHSQSSGTAEKPLLHQLVDAGVEITIGTSTSGSRYICHTKGIAVDGRTGPLCWEGSVNFSTSGWLQVNTAMDFSSPDWRDHFVAQFATLRKFAWANERDLQLMPEPPDGVDTESTLDRPNFRRQPRSAERRTRE
ncbi:phospholipase D-like domain-containing protein [Amycolatopsis sp. CA-230715]|uniref:phospholipase D-like domain-containing protein n=1 Tax=Amycolatopsis sp. CA-230715 TaxID=2745196 RepID=UPI001C032702|nr:phospholipase D-like domain-containing protein [Amycolatopsis sp. CA-230715]